MDNREMFGTFSRKRIESSWDRAGRFFVKLPADGNGIGLPVGALAAHCVLSIGNDVGPVVRNDVVVVLSIGGQSLCRTGHLAL